MGFLKPSFFCGIDPGHHGAIAIMSASGKQVLVHKMPITDTEPPEIDLPGLRYAFETLKTLPNVLIGIEWPKTWPGAFSNVARDAEVFGRGKGYLEAFAFLHNLTYKRIDPAQWKQRLGLPGKSNPQANQIAAAYYERNYPGHVGLIRGPRGGLLDGPLDALLIAHFLRMQGSNGLKSIAQQFGKDSIEMQAFILGGAGYAGKRRRGRIPLKSDLTKPD